MDGQESMALGTIFAETEFFSWQQRSESVDSPGVVFPTFFKENAMKMPSTTLLLLVGLFAVMPFLPSCAGGITRVEAEISPAAKGVSIIFRFTYTHLILPTLSLRTAAVGYQENSTLSADDMPELSAGQGADYYQITIENGSLAGTTYTFASTFEMYDAFATIAVDLGTTDPEALGDLQYVADMIASHWMTPTEFNEMFGR